MRVFLYQIAVTLFHLGGFGLLMLGVLDSSFLFMPLGNDLLVIAMTARNRSLMFYYAAMATAGSVLGCLLIDVIFRKGGEELLAKHVSRSRFEYIRKRVEKGAAWVRIPMMPIRRSDPMPISAERSDARLSQSETLIDIRQEFCGSGR